MFDRTDAFAVTEMDLHLDVVDRGRLAVLAGAWPHQSCWSGHDCRYQHERCAGEGHERGDEGMQAVGNRPAIGASAHVWTPFKRKNTSCSEPCELSEVAEVEEDVPTLARWEEHAAQETPRRWWTGWKGSRTARLDGVCVEGRLPPVETLCEHKRRCRA